MRFHVNESITSVTTLGKAVNSQLERLSTLKIAHDHQKQYNAKQKCEDQEIICIINNC